jgi:hypothetical protein
MEPIVKLASTLRVSPDYISNCMKLSHAEIKRRAWIADALLNAYVVLRLEQKMSSADLGAWHDTRSVYVANAKMALLVRDLNIKGHTHAKGTFVEALLYNATDETFNAYCEWVESNEVF